MTFDDTDYDAIEADLNSQPPGPRYSLSMPSKWSIRRLARRQGRLKQKTLANNERYLEQVTLPAYRDLAVGSGGWVSSVNTTDAEQLAVKDELQPYFEQRGLTITQLWLAWTGMSSGGSGNYESYNIVIRLA